jgi:hypothetical protein
MEVVASVEGTASHRSNGGITATSVNSRKL